MKDFFWSLFEKSGSIDAFMAYKEYRDFEKSPTQITADKKE